MLWLETFCRMTLLGTGRSGRFRQRSNQAQYCEISSANQKQKQKPDPVL